MTCGGCRLTWASGPTARTQPSQSVSSEAVEEELGREARGGAFRSEVSESGDVYRARVTG